MSFVCAQKKIVLSGRKRGSHLVTKEVYAKAGDLIASVTTGTCHLFLRHTSAGLSINENADPTVREDLCGILHGLVPDGLQYAHSCEGPDDMPAHALSTISGCSLTIPITEGKLNLGVWQGIYLMEYRKYGGDREIMVTVQGVGKGSS